jgi:hypothetical protein
VIDDRGLAPGGSAAEGRRGVIDDRGLAPGGSAAEGRRGVIDKLDLRGLYADVRARGEIAGAPATDPKILLGLPGLRHQ